MELITSPFAGAEVTARGRKLRSILFIFWIALMAWFLSFHAFWEDEIRAFTLALSGANVVEMLRIVHGEGHPAIWYLLLRGVHELFPYREVLPIVAALVGIATVVVVAVWSPFRIGIVALVLFSLYCGFEYVVIARNYGIAALVMFSLAALYPRVKDTPWFGALLVILCNTNVPSCVLAAMFLLFRFVELAGDQGPDKNRKWLVFLGNAVLALIGAFVCFRTVYPTFNDAAVSPQLQDLSVSNLMAGILDYQQGFYLGLSLWPPLRPLLLLISCLAFIRKPAALAAALGGLLALKLFFYFIYPASYRHEALYTVFLLSLHWMTAQGAGGMWPTKPWMDYVRVLSTWVFIELLAVQSYMLFAAAIPDQLLGYPFSRSRDVAALLNSPELSGAIVMGDPDTMVEPLPYYVNNPLWLLREQRFGNIVHLTHKGRRDLTLDDVLADAERLHRQTGRPIVYLSQVRLDKVRPGQRSVMIAATTQYSAESVARFRASTRFIAKLRPAVTHEHYDVYVYPR